MGNDNERDQMLEVYIFEENQLIDQLEEIMLETEKSSEFSKQQVNEIFRIMHTIKGSSAMMTYDNIAKLAKLQTATASSALSMMEMKGWVKNIGGQNYILL